MHASVCLGVCCVKYKGFHVYWARFGVPCFVFTPHYGLSCLSCSGSRLGARLSRLLADPLSEGLLKEAHPATKSKCVREGLTLLASMECEGSG